MAFDNVSEKGQDYSTKFGTPVGVPVGGTIMRIVHNNNAINDVVELQDSSKAVWLYQHITATVKVGDVLQCGSIIGTENGLPVDQYSTGPHIEVRYALPNTWSESVISWNEPWVNPVSYFAALTNQRAGSVTSGGTPFTQKNGTLLGGWSANIPIAPDASVADFFYGLDVALELQNPFDVTIQSGGDITVLGVDTGIPNPGSDALAIFEGAQQVLTNIVQDLSAIAFRTVFILVGVAILVAIAFQAQSQGMDQALAPVGGKAGAAKTIIGFL